ncbi:MAG: bifunctional oligoribonuclease/PAP phosphatase NrnA [Acidobacteria bacterium]|nr:bifunctional oligoribonuclease/PAP phosphatase NrnA [Acidobacteriota bacterium]
MIPTPRPDPALAEIVARLTRASRIVVASHERPDGDAIGSGLALVLALRAIGKEAQMAVCAVPPANLQPFPAVDNLWITGQVDEAFDAAVIMECGDLARTGITGLDRSPVLNIDHHPGNTRYGVVNWVDESAAACGELVYVLITALGAPVTADVATHIYLAILTDTGSFHFSHLSPRTFDIAARCVEAGARPEWIARTHYDSHRMARVHLFGSVLSGMVVDPSGQIALLTMTPDMAADAGGSYDDTEGLINFPLSVKDVRAVAFFRQADRPEQWRVSLRSKGAVDVGALATTRGGGGHRNAAACSLTGPIEALRAELMQALTAAVADAPAEP